MKYPNISAREMHLLDELDRRGRNVFNPVETSNILGVSRDAAHRILSRMMAKGLVDRLERGKYISRSNLENMDIYEVACQIVQSSYISLWSGLHIYGYTTQVPRIVYLMVGIPRSGLSIRGHELKFVRTKHFFGYRMDGGRVLAEPEKLFLDCLLFPEYSGGIGEIRDALKIADLDGEKLMEYALSMDNKSLNSRLGYILEEAGKDIDLSSIREKISRSYVPLDTTRENRGQRCKRWMLTLNGGK